MSGPPILSKARTRLNLAIAGSKMVFVAMTDEFRSCGDPDTLIKNLPRGGILIFRHYSHPYRTQLAAKTVLRCHRKSIRCLIAGDIQLAKNSKADGVHFPEHQLTKMCHQHQRPKRWITTASAHNLKALHKAKNFGLDAILVSPVFATNSHMGAKPLGIFKFATICRQAPVPIIALGGITSSRINRVRRAGAIGIAGVSLFSGK